jgi:hypothetical protein
MFKRGVTPISEMRKATKKSSKQPNNETLIDVNDPKIVTTNIFAEIEDEDPYQ